MIMFVELFVIKNDSQVSIPTINAVPFQLPQSDTGLYKDVCLHGKYILYSKTHK